MTFSGQQRVWIDLFCIETNVMCCVQMLTFRMLDPRKVSRFQPLLQSRFPLAIRVKLKLNSTAVATAFSDLFIPHGQPEFTRSDNCARPPSAVVRSAAVTLTPTLRQRSISTRVAVYGKQTVALEGRLLAKVHGTARHFLDYSRAALARINLVPH